MVIVMNGLNRMTETANVINARIKLMANENKIISFWKRVKLKSSDMFTLFRVGIGVKVPTNKLHVKDSSNPLKVEGMTVVGGSSGVEGYSIVQADSNGIFYTASISGGVAIDDLYDHSGDLYLSATGAGDVIIAGDLTVSGNDIIFEGATADEYETKLTAADTTGSDKTLTLPNLTGTIATTDVAGGGTGAATFTSNAILTGNGTSAIQAESTLTYNGEILSIGVDDSGFVNLSRIDHSDGAGGNFQILAGSAGGDNTAGGSLKLYAGYGKGSGGGGDIQFISNGTSGTASTTPTPAVVAVISKEGNLQIDGGLTVGSTSFVNSSGVVQVATQGTIDHDSLANFVTAEHVDWAGSSAGTVHSSNIPTLNQDTTGTAATVTAGTQAAITTCANLVTTGTIGTGVWQGTAVASAYLDADTAHLSGIQSFTGQKTFTARIIQDGDQTLAPGDGAGLHIDASDITDGTTSASGTTALFTHVNIENPRIFATNASVTTTNAATVLIKGAPVASTNQTITNAWALKISGGAVDISTVTEGTWQGTAIASAYLDADTAHLTTAQTFTGVKEINSRKYALPSSTVGDYKGGDIYYYGDGSTVKGGIYYINGTNWTLADADAEASTSGLLAVALGTDPDADGMLLRGFVTLLTEVEGTEAIGSVVYLSATNAGKATITVPGSGDFVRVLGYSLHASDNQVYFNPDNTWVEVS